MSNMPVGPKWVSTKARRSPMYQIGVFESEAKPLYFVAALPAPMASSTKPEKAAKQSPVTRA